MALMVPDSVPLEASQGEKQVFYLLRDQLPDDFLVYYEPTVSGLYPDFIILGPTFGLLVLEIKGWSANQIQSADNQFFHINQGDKIERCQSPLRQGKGYLDALLHKLKSYPILCHNEGEYQGKLTFPLGVGAIMSGMTEAQAQESNIYPVLEKPQVCYRDELRDWSDWSERQLIKRLEQFFTHRFKFWGLEEDQISTIRGIIHPESQVRVEPAKETSAPPGQPVRPNTVIIRTLDHHQEQLARSLQSGHRLFCGVAGSGKTLILLSRAKTLASGLFKRRVLILCFNITLAAYLRSFIEENDNSSYPEQIQVMYFHEWAKSVLGGLPNFKHYDDDNHYQQEVGERLLNALRAIPIEQRWDAVLVDEAHTFHPKWFECCTLAMKDPVNGDLVIVSDRSQSLYPRQKFTWKSVGIKAQGRVKKLTSNYRNTQEILQAAWEIAGSNSEPENDDETFPVVEPKAALRRGQKPQLHLMHNRMDEVDGAIATIQQLVGEGFQPQDIAIIYRYIARSEGESFHHLTQTLDELGIGAYWVNQDKQNYSRSHPGVKLVTGKSALGLEFKVVILLWVQQFGVGEPTTAKRELYVAMTRAQDRLYLFGSGNFSFLQDLQESELLEVAS